MRAWSAAITCAAGPRARRVLPTSRKAALLSSVPGPAIRQRLSSVLTAVQPAVAWRQTARSASGSQSAGAGCGDQVASASAAGRRSLQAHGQVGACEAAQAAVAGLPSWQGGGGAAAQLAAKVAHFRQLGTCVTSVTMSCALGMGWPCQAATRACPRFACSSAASEPSSRRCAATSATSWAEASIPAGPGSGTGAATGAVG